MFLLVGTLVAAAQASPYSSVQMEEMKRLSISCRDGKNLSKDVVQCTDDARDAYRHTWAAIALSRQYGPAATLGAGNVNEVQGYVRSLFGQSGYTAAARAMDDHNNYVGAALGADSRYADMSPTELVDFAFANGCVVKAP